MTASAEHRAVRFLEVLALSLTVHNIATPIPQALDGIASLGNQNHWTGWIASLEDAIASRAEEKGSLADAACYAAWLLLSAEYFAYRLRWHFYADGSFGEGVVFDEAYSALLKRCEPIMPPAVLADAKFIIDARHVLVHKGFPNPQAAPLHRKGADACASLAVRDLIKSPSNYPTIRAKFQTVHSWLATATPSVTFGI